MMNKTGDSTSDNGSHTVDAELIEPVEFAVAEAMAYRASDIHLRPDSRGFLRVDGVLRPLEACKFLSAETLDKVVDAFLTEKQAEKLQQDGQVDFSIHTRRGVRLRANAFRQSGTTAMAMRVVASNIPTPEELGLPEITKQFITLEHGLVLLTGATGSGKSTTIASLLDQVNELYAKHIITIEDPIEYRFTEKKAVISQRELGIDLCSFAQSMRAALREDPDVILLGEMRDRETIETALTAAETGHLVFSTVHAPTAPEVIPRMIAELPPEAQPTMRAKLSQNLRAVIAQRLLPRAGEKGRVMACEVMTVSARVRELVLDPLKVKTIGDLVKQSSIVDGMLSFDKSLFDLCRAGLIDEETALQNASSPTDLKLMLDGFTR